MSISLFAFVLFAFTASAIGHGSHGPHRSGKWSQEDKFRQLEELLPTPNGYRTASGAPGHAYWQQKVDYVIDVSLDEETRRITGSQRITYTNNSPDTLSYLWVMLEMNLYAPDSMGARIQLGGDRGIPSLEEKATPSQIKRLLERTRFDGSHRLTRVQDGRGSDLEFTINDTMMRIDLPESLEPGEQFEFEIDWSFVLNDASEVWARGGAEWFEEDGNWLFEVAHWFPRLAPYTDTRGWHNKQFLGRGEFALEFGDYVVNITVPSDHIVAATGELQNSREVLSREQRARLDEARDSEEPMFIVTPEEAMENQKSKADGTKTWTFKAMNVRDFAWASSRKFAWDAATLVQNGNPILCMSFFPNEGEPLWSRYSTHAIMHTIEVYSRYTFDYPYPVAISVNGPVGGMEYPMICFNGPRPEPDGTYTKRTKYGLIGVIIHEVGHFYFPMIVNSDERQWTWMDEGLNTFLQTVAQEEWEPNYPSRRGPARSITSYMADTYQVPIMTNSESLLQFGANAYAKPAAALNVLRETVMGRELFDYAFREYSQRWMFKNPQPADFFRTMEDASGVDLDWFWRGWFYSTDHVDIAVTNVHRKRMAPTDPDARAALDKADRDAEPDNITEARNILEGKGYRTDRYPDLLDFYNEWDDLNVLPEDRETAERFLASLEADEAEYIDLDLNFTFVTFENIGGLVMPLLVELHFVDGTTELQHIPAEVWRRNNEEVTKLFITAQEIAQVRLDPQWETADTNRENNAFPRQIETSRFLMHKEAEEKNTMQKVLQGDEGEDDEQEEN